MHHYQLIEIFRLLLNNKIAVIFMNIQVNCPKCQRRYANDNPPKKLINCSHVLCQQCLSNQILCPIDRKRLERRKYTIQAFQTHHDILKFILSQQEVKIDNEKPLQEQSMGVLMAIQSPACVIYKQPYPENKLKEEQIYHPASSQQLHMKQSNKQIQKAFDPKFEDIRFDTCLLHSKSADLICLKDKCLICSSCGLFGQHKNHDMLPYDTFIGNYMALMEQSINNFDILKNSQEKIAYSSVVKEIDALIQQKWDLQVKNIKKIMKNLILTIKNTQKNVINQIQLSLKEKKGSLLMELHLSQLQNKINAHYGEIQKLSKGSIDIFKIQNIEQYIDYVDKNSQRSYTNKEGEYLIVEIDNFSKSLRKKIFDSISQLQCNFNHKLNGLVENSFQIITKEKIKIEITQIQTQQKKEVEVKNSPKISNKCKEQDLLINSKSNEDKNKGNVRDMSPIQPIPKFQQTFDTIFKNSYKDNIISEGREEVFHQINEVSKSSNSLLFVPPYKKTVNFGNHTLNHPCGLKQNQYKKDIENINQIRYHAKTKSNNSSHIVQREILNVLNDNKKKRKLELPQKYAKIYEELIKDKLDILDFGGASLGDQIILTISQLFESRNKLKSVKLMNNKISDEIFPDLLFRCRNICSINLSYNNLTEKSLEWLQKQVEYLGCLTNITISNNKIVLRSVKDRIQNLRKKGIKVSL